MLRAIIAFFLVVATGILGFAGVLAEGLAIFVQILFFLAIFFFVMILTSGKRRVME